VAFVYVIGAVGFAPAPLPRPDRGRGDPAEADLAAMQGTWRVKNQSNGDNKTNASGWRVVVSGPRMRYVRPNGQVAVEYDVVLNARAKPRAMDLFGGEPRAEKVLWRGTYAFRDKELLMSFPLTSDDRDNRPTACGPGPKWLFEICERVRP
jgi:uncharacterized protein (TIGR03067 family)